MRLGLTIIAVLLLTVRANGQEAVVAARDLYLAAAYEDALAVLDRIDKSGDQASDRFAVNQYRAFSLLALGRNVEAEQVIESLVLTAPLYQPSETEASPRLRAVFTTVRQRMLPSIIQQKYTLAKQAFERKDFEAAADGFSQVLDALADPALSDAVGRSPLSDLTTLAAGFRDLAEKSIPPPPPPAPAPQVEAAVTPTPAPVMAPMPPRVYNAGEAGVVPPVILRQALPPLPRGIGATRPGVLEVIINEEGTVDTVVLRTSMNVKYDNQAIAAARNWKYRPAMFAGTPVKYRKFVSVEIKTSE
jgi:TonB family protein